MCCQRVVLHQGQGRLQGFGADNNDRDDEDDREDGARQTRQSSEQEISKAPGLRLPVR